MPIYEYLCGTCGERFEALVFGGQLPDCPRCGGHELEKQLSAFAVGGRGAASRPVSSGPGPEAG